jgi:hypothetical protein
VWAYLLMVALAVLGVQLVFQLFKRNEIKEFLTRMQIIDIKMHDLNLNVDHLRCKRVIRFWVLFILIAILSRIIYIGGILGSWLKNVDTNVFIQELLYCYFLMYESFFCFQFIFSAYLLRTRIRVLRDYLRCFSFNMKIFNFKLFGEIYHDMCDSIEQINSLFAIHLPPILLEMLLINVFGLYGFVRFVTAPNETSQVCIILFYISAHLLLNISICSVGHSTTFEAESVKVALSRILNNLPPADYSRSNFKDLLKQFSVRNLRFQTVFFNIDWSVFLAVSYKLLFNSIKYVIYSSQTSSTVVTYLVIT